MNETRRMFIGGVRSAAQDGGTFSDRERDSIGPIINQKQLDTITGQVDDAVKKGAQLLVGVNTRGLFHEATVLANMTREMSIDREETFGPVAPLVTVKSDLEPVAVANDTDYGLSAGIIPRNEERALETPASSTPAWHTATAAPSTANADPLRWLKGQWPRPPWGQWLGSHLHRDALDHI